MTSEVPLYIQEREPKKEFVVTIPNPDALRSPTKKELNDARSYEELAFSVRSQDVLSEKSSGSTERGYLDEVRMTAKK